MANPVVKGFQTADGTAKYDYDSLANIPSGLYTKPAAGIPETDLDSATRAKLDSIGSINDALENRLNGGAT